MKITTRTGDGGQTSLLFGARVPKTDPRIRANGTLDELSVAIGLVRAGLGNEHPLGARLRDLQLCLIALMGEVAVENGSEERYARAKIRKLTEADLTAIDSWIGELEQLEIEVKDWAVPGDFAESIHLEQARIASRKAERELYLLQEAGHRVSPNALSWLNRCSDLFWLIARALEQNQIR